MLDLKKFTLLDNLSDPANTCILYLRCTRKNVFCTLIDNHEKRVRFSYSLGVSEISDQLDIKKNTYLRSKLLSQHFINKIKELNFSTVRIILKGLGPGRATLLSAIRNSNLHISDIQDTTLVPHNGCRGPKQRRKKLRTRVSFKIKRLVSPS